MCIYVFGRSLWVFLVYNGNAKHNSSNNANAKNNNNNTSNNTSSNSNNTSANGNAKHTTVIMQVLIAVLCSPVVSEGL